MAKIAEEDRQRLLESGHDVAALVDAGQLTGDETLKRALVRSRERLALARVRLLEAVQKNFQESGETSQTRVDVETLARGALRQYGFVRGKVSDALLNVDPDEDPGSDEVAKRATVFASVFSKTGGGVAGRGAGHRRGRRRGRRWQPRELKQSPSPLQDPPPNPNNTFSQNLLSEPSLRTFSQNLLSATLRSCLIS
jgi:hypothetical protein